MDNFLALFFFTWSLMFALSSSMNIATDSLYLKEHIYQSDLKQNTEDYVKKEHELWPTATLTLPIDIVVNTWNMSKATVKAWSSLTAGADPVDSVVAGCSVCEDGSCEPSIGRGGSPDEDGETTLDAMVMDGRTMDVGSVGCLRDVQDAIAVAHAVMKYTKHTLLVGDLATKFALSMGFEKKSLQTNVSHNMWIEWQKNKCQPNFWQNVKPDPKSSCGPYNPSYAAFQEYKKIIEKTKKSDRYNPNVDENHHDTIGMVILDSEGNIASGTTTNGANHKVMGRVGDSPIVGAGSYAQNGVGGAAATGDGDVMMRFSPSFNAVQLMAQGLDPTSAAKQAIALIAQYYPKNSAALIAVNAQGIHGAACLGFTKFPYNVRSRITGQVQTVHVQCT